LVDETLITREAIVDGDGPAPAAKKQVNGSKPSSGSHRRGRRRCSDGASLVGCEGYPDEW
jgi:hypothetical protein